MVVLVNQYTAAAAEVLAAALQDNQRAQVVARSRSPRPATGARRWDSPGACVEWSAARGSSACPCHAADLVRQAIEGLTAQGATSFVLDLRDTSIWVSSPSVLPLATPTWGTTPTPSMACPWGER